MHVLILLIFYMVKTGELIILTAFLNNKKSKINRIYNCLFVSVKTIESLELWSNQHLHLLIFYV